jgi:hypothetical protein
MTITQTEAGWLIKPENNKEEIALMSFLSRHKPVAWPQAETGSDVAKPDVSQRRTRQG